MQPQSPEQQGQPAQQPAPTPPPSAPGAPTPDGNKPKKGLLIGVIIAAIVLLAVGVGLAFALNQNNDEPADNNTSTSRDQDDEQASDEQLRAANATTARYLSNFDVVCGTGSVTNAADYAEPYKIAAFSKTEDARSWSSVTLPYDADYRADYDNFEETNVVACLSEKAGTAVKAETCEFTSQGERVSVDYYAVQYDLTLYQAKTGQKIEDLGTINGPATNCPSFATYNPNDPKIYARPDADAVGAALNRFVAE